MSKHSLDTTSVKSFQGIHSNSPLNITPLSRTVLFVPSLAKSNNRYLNRLFLFTLARHKKIAIFTYTPCSHLYQRLLPKESQGLQSSQKCFVVCVSVCACTYTCTGIHVCVCIYIGLSVCACKCVKVDMEARKKPVVLRCCPPFF